MLYAFFLFWPANVVPVWMLVTLLQFFIPLNMLFRSCCIGMKHHPQHYIAGLIILVAVVLTIVDVNVNQMDGVSGNYAILFLISSLFDVVSHALKESIVRTQPPN